MTQTNEAPPSVSDPSPTSNQFPDRAATPIDADPVSDDPLPVSGHSPAPAPSVPAPASVTAPAPAPAPAFDLVSVLASDSGAGPCGAASDSAPLPASVTDSPLPPALQNDSQGVPGTKNTVPSLLLGPGSSNNVPLDADPAAETSESVPGSWTPLDVPSGSRTSKAASTKPKRLKGR